jgi:hypothetical protein
VSCKPKKATLWKYALSPLIIAATAGANGLPFPGSLYEFCSEIYKVKLRYNKESKSIFFFFLFSLNKYGFKKQIHFTLTKETQGAGKVQKIGLLQM